MITEELCNKLSKCYEEIMWLARRDNLTHARARAWYSAVRREEFKTKICMFTGMVSKLAVSDRNAELVREHYGRMNTTLTKFITRHVEENLNSSKEFIDTIIDCERVNITTKSENDDAKKANGDYDKAGITLVKWDNIDKKRRNEIWESKLHGNVANANDFAF